MRISPISFTQFIALLFLFALSLGEIRCDGKSGGVQVVTSSTHTMYTCKKSVDGDENIGERWRRGQKISSLPVIARVSAGNNWLTLRGGVRNWGSSRDKEGNDEMGQDVLLSMVSFGQL